MSNAKLFTDHINSLVRYKKPAKIAKSFSLDQYVSTKIKGFFFWYIKSITDKENIYIRYPNFSDIKWLAILYRFLLCQPPNQ